MRKNLLCLLLLAGSALLSKAQNQVSDTHPAASIYIIDYQSGQAVSAVSNDAILFKDAFIDLVVNSNRAEQMYTKAVPGRKTFTVTQVNSDETGNSYKLTLDNKFLGQETLLYTFLYNVDQNTLYYFDPNQQNWVPETVVGNNLSNLNNCYAFSKFNDPPQDANNNQQPGDEAVNNTPVDADVSTRSVPPPLPEYQQPECPTDGYLWQPGFWAYNGNGYYWVPGVWVAPPDPGYLWTPPYWGYTGGLYLFHSGYWGSSVGFYGGINYGYGYQGNGFVGGEWNAGRFRYNTAVTRVNTTVIHNTYVNNTVINNTVVNNNRASFNGQGGVNARPTPAQVVTMKQPHIPPTTAQLNNQRVARSDKSQFAAANNGRPANLAAAKAPAVAPVNRTTMSSQQRTTSKNPAAPLNQNPQTPGRPGNNGSFPGRQNTGQTFSNPGRQNTGQTFTTPGRTNNNGNVRPAQPQPNFNRTMPARQPQTIQRQPSRPTPAPQRQDDRKKN